MSESARLKNKKRYSMTPILNVEEVISHTMKHEFYFENSVFICKTSINHSLGSNT